MSICGSLALVALAGFLLTNVGMLVALKIVQWRDARRNRRQGA